MARGELIGCFGLTDPTAAPIREICRRTAGGVAVEWGKDVDHQGLARRAGRGLGRDGSWNPRFRVEAGVPGILRHPDRAKSLPAGLRDRGTILDNVLVPEENVLPGALA